MSEPHRLRAICPHGPPASRSYALLAVAAFLLVASLPSGLSSPAHPTRTDVLFSEAHPQAAASEPTYAWTDLSTILSAAPSPRWAPAAAYSPSLKEVILFGGYNVTVTPDGDTWAFSSNHWTEVPAAPAPPARWGAEMVYDAADGYLLLFGGRNLTQYFNDTWAYGAGGWHQVDTAAAPSARSFFGLAYDPAAGEVVLFGGSGLGNLPAGAGNPAVYYNDTWTYKAGVWTNITSIAGPAPSPRAAAALSYDSITGDVLLQGGGSGSAPCGIAYNDTWEFNGGSWIQLSPVSSPPASGGDSLQFDTSTNTTILYQGLIPGTASENSCSTFVSSLWSYSDGNWTLITVNSSLVPAGRGNPAWVYDPVEAEVLLFGGSGAAQYEYLGDTWILSVVAPLAMGAVLSANRPSADVGQTTTFTAGAVTGGEPPYTYLWSGLPGGCPTGAAAVACDFVSPATLSISVSVTDALGSTNSSVKLTYSVYPDPYVTNYLAGSPNPDTVGSDLTFSVNVSGGSGGFTYHWTGLPPGCTSVDARSFSCVATRAGTFNNSVTVNDSNGESTGSPTSMEIVLAPPASPHTNTPSSAAPFYESPYFLAGAALILVAALVVAFAFTRRRPSSSSPSSPTPPPAGPPPSR